MNEWKPTLSNRVYRQIWSLIYFIFFRFTPTNLHIWRILILKTFGAKVRLSCSIYPDAKIYMPCNLIMDEKSCLGPRVNCYNVAKIQIGKFSTVSQDSHLCTAGHNYNYLAILDNPVMKTLASEIIIEENCWITSEVFIAPGVIIRQGSVILSRAVQTKSTQEWSVNGGHPSKYIKKRLLQ